MQGKLSTISRIIQKLMLGIWLTLIVICLGLYLIEPGSFTAANIASFLVRFQGAIWLAYLIVSILRGLTLLPSTPLVIAGTVLFPDDPWSVLALSMVGIIISSTMIYYFSEYLGFHETFESRKPELTHKIRARLERPSGIFFVALWAFFPFVPTDLVCYVAGTTKMNFNKFIAAITIGELVLCSFYIFLGGTVFRPLN